MSQELTQEIWTQKLEEGMKGLEELVGKKIPAPIMGQGEHHTSEMPLCNKMITDDMIRLYASAIGDFNPLWVDEEYAKKTRWGSIIAPPMCEIMVAETASVPPPLEIPGLSYLNGGSTRTYHAPIHPGDRFNCFDIFQGFKEKSNPDKPYRLFILTGLREFYNQNDEHVLDLKSNILLMARYPKPGKGPKQLDFSNEKRHYFTDEELALFHASYDADIDGSNRFGLGKRDWDSVQIGDELPARYRGPYDFSDAISLFAVTGYSMAFAKKWATMRNNPGAFRKDPETGELHAAPDWHFSDELARMGNVPFAPIFGTHIEASMMQGVTDWIGTDARIAEVSSAIRKMIFLGDVFICKGKVADKYIEDGKKFVKLDLWAEKYGTDIISATGYAIVEL